MKIKLVTLHKIKSFDGPTTLTFDPNKNLYSLSGKNGSGKSSVLRAIWLIQKLHFCSALGATEEEIAAKLEARKLLTDRSSSVRVELSVPNKHGKESPASITLLLVEDQPTLRYTNGSAISEIWNPESPTNIFLFIDASKEFSRETLRHDEIKISNNSQKNIALQAILNPDQLFHSVYKQLVMDYVHDRLVPSKPNRLEYFRIAKHTFTKLIPEIELSNFSGNHTEGEFVLLGKANRSRRTALYDVRDFSSGEKTLLSTLVVLSLASTVAVVLIDEPENHLHESLLLTFMGMLRDFCLPSGSDKWLSDYLARPGIDSADEEANKESPLRINQVIYSTHSKSLIYHTFSLGQNFLIDNGISEVLDRDLESNLRKVGLSTIHKTVIFVEGQDDNEALHQAFGGENFIVRPLNGSSAVSDTYKRIASIGNELQGYRYIFIIDSDNKPDEYFNGLREINPKFYDQNFIKLDRHELENYLLDPEIFHETLSHYHSIHPIKTGLPSIGEIKTKLSEIGRQTLPQVYKKELSLAFQHHISSEFSNSIWGKRDFDWTSEETIVSQINNDALSTKKMTALIEKLKETVSQIYAGYNTASEETIINRCDGKQAFSRACDYYARMIGLNKGIFQEVLYSSAMRRTDSQFSEIINKVKKAISQH